MLEGSDSIASVVNKRSPESEKVPMIRIRISHTMIAMNTGTILVMVVELMTVPEPRLVLPDMAMEIPHHVSTALKPAARNQAPKR